MCVAGFLDSPLDPATKTVAVLNGCLGLRISYKRYNSYRTLRILDYTEFLPLIGFLLLE